MKVLILIYFLLFNSITTDSGDCSNAFEALLQSKCNSIKISGTENEFIPKENVMYFIQNVHPMKEKIAQFVKE